MILFDDRIRKKYHPGKIIFQGADVSIESGLTYLLFGDNGSGKSTLLRILAQDESYIRFRFNDQPQPNFRYRPDQVSYMQSDLVFYRSMKVTDLFRFHRDLDRRFDAMYADDALTKFQIDRTAKIVSLSDGQRKLVNFILCMARRCDLYLIDEPFPNVDLKNIEKCVRMIIDRQSLETTFVIATHQIGEVETIADHILWIRHQDIINESADTLRDETARSVESNYRRDSPC
ncbi:MAG TPA: hypothetical protein DCR44_05980 [Acholeplasmatales bacterium]|nr:MAG: hypothetical protein A2Y16_06210 [Tenericutes bacterium GWF2_57_13]HAQ56927.1 hypothetical protein [Acholeplasmatales bacterium]